MLFGISGCDYPSLLRRFGCDQSLTPHSAQPAGATAEYVGVPYRLFCNFTQERTVASTYLGNIFEILFLSAVWRCHSKCNV